TYPILRWVLACLGDHHSHLLSPQSRQDSLAGKTTSLGLTAVYPEAVIVEVQVNSPAEQAGLQVRDIITTINGMPIAQLDHTTFTRMLNTSPLSLTCRRAPQEVPLSATLYATPYIREMRPHGWPVGPDIGYLALPAVTGNDTILKPYAHTAQQYLRDMDGSGIRRWVIDLRRNGGGDMWAMVVGVQALLGDGEWGFFVSPDGTKRSWLPTKAVRLSRLLDEPYVLTQPAVAIAVLTSRLTCSAGEFTTLVFRGCPHIRSFGEPTAGLPTGNQNKILRDGAQLFLTVVLGADRTGRSYDGPILPDEPVTSDWTLFQTARDPVMMAVVEWLRSQDTA
ncbi:MAG: S41 family peptidase, partial [Ktedonobacteraceae bacterium]